MALPKLSRAGLAGRFVRGAGKCTGPRAFLVDPDHGAVDYVDVASFPLQVADGFRLDRTFFARFGINQMLYEVRSEHDAIIGQRCRRLSQLDRCVSVVALTDAD